MENKVLSPQSFEWMYEFLVVIYANLLASGEHAVAGFGTKRSGRLLGDKETGVQSLLFPL